MKKSVALVLSLLLLLPLAYAEISLEPLTENQYNIGDTVNLEGSITLDDDTTGYLQLSFLCDDDSYPLQSTPLSLDGGDTVDLNTLSLPWIRVSSSLSGLCRVKADVLVNDVSVDQEVSTSFEVTPELEGEFSVYPLQLQFGDTLTFTGDVQQLDGDAVDGTVEIYFEQEDVEYLVGFTAINNGAVSYELPLYSGHPGDNSVNLLVRDIFGNEQRFENALTFTITDELYVFVDTNVDSVLPGRYVNVFGDVKTITQEYVTAGSVEVTLGDETFSTELSDSQYTYDLLIPKTLASGEHEVKVSVQDSHGNGGSAVSTIIVESLASSVVLGSSVSETLPEEEIVLEASLYDQAGELIEADVSVDVLDPNGELADSLTLVSGQEYYYDMPAYAIPGEWTIVAAYALSEENVLRDHLTLPVDSLQLLDYVVEGETLYITNAGNVLYTDDIELEIEGVENAYLVKKSKNLDPGESVVIDLSEEVPTGTYSLSVLTGLNVADVGEVSVEDGKSRAGLGWLYSLFALFFIAGLSYSFYARMKGPSGKKKKGKGAKSDGDDGFVESGSVHVKKNIKKKRLYDPKRSKDGKPSITFEDKKESIEDFKRRTLKEIKRVQAMDSRSKSRAQVSSGKLGYVIGKTSDGKIGVPSPLPKKSKPKSSAGSFFGNFD